MNRRNAAKKTTKKSTRARGSKSDLVSGKANTQPKQSQIPGTEREVNEELEDAIESLQKAKKKRTTAKDAVDQSTEDLAALLESSGITSYVSVQHEAQVGLVDKRRVSIKKYVVKEAGLDEEGR